MAALLFELVLILGCWVVLLFDVCVVLVRLLGIFAAFWRVFGDRRVLLGGLMLEFRLRLEVLFICEVTICWGVGWRCRACAVVVVGVRGEIT
jgi:hypothetical protein